MKNFLHRDHLACAIQITDAAGAVVTRRDFRPFGDGEGLEWVDPLTQPDSKGFIGERAGAETGPHSLHARYYDPKLALFTQGDWWDPTDPGVGTNRTIYALGDPVNLGDPNGHQVDRGNPTRAASLPNRVPGRTPFRQPRPRHSVGAQGRTLPRRPGRRPAPKQSQPSQHAAAGPAAPGADGPVPRSRPPR